MGILQKVHVGSTYVATDDSQPQSCLNEKSHTQPMVGVINVISMGPRLRRSDDSESSPKCRRSNDDVIFSEGDLQGDQTSHNDAVIVLMMIVNYDVK